MSIAFHTTSRGFGVAVATLLSSVAAWSTVRARATREIRPSFELYSKLGHRGFGDAFAADGTTIVVPDFECRTGRGGGGRVCHVFAMIDEVDGDRVDERARVDFSPHAAGTFAIAGETIVMRAPEKFRPELVMTYARQGKDWRLADELEVSPECRMWPGDSSPEVYLSGDLLVLPRHNGAEACIYERAGTSWRAITRIRLPDDRVGLGVSRDRVAVVRPQGVDVYAASTAWQPSRVITASPGSELYGLAISSRWLVTRADDRLLVFDLDTPRLVATLSPQVDGAFPRFAVGATTIATTGTVDEVWSYDAEAWSATGTLVGANDKGSPSRSVAIGDVIWIGNPRVGEGRDGGTIHGFRIPAR